MSRDTDDGAGADMPEDEISDIDGHFKACQLIYGKVSAKNTGFFTAFGNPFYFRLGFCLLNVFFNPI